MKKVLFGFRFIRYDGPKAAFTPGQNVTSNLYPDTYMSTDTMSPDTSCSFGTRRHNYYSFMSRSTCIPLYPATEGRQTGDNFVADTRNMLTSTSGYKWIQLVSGNMCLV